MVLYISNLLEETHFFFCGGGCFFMLVCMFVVSYFEQSLYNV